MAPPKRRVSYVIPPPVDHVPRLKLPPLGFPRHGSPRPVLFLSQHQPEAQPKPSQPRHRLGVTSLALDSTTQLQGLPTPQGIIYTGSRDGQVISWDLGLKLKPRRNPSSRNRPARWETLTGMADTGEETEEEERRDGDILGDVKEGGGRKRSSSVLDDIPYEHGWELDPGTLNFTADSHFRQCSQLHTDWINDILLCNYNQTLISASSDGTVKAWNPHSNPSTDPSIIGTHTDYVRCLAFCRESNWIVSGSFDRSIKLWDLTLSSPTPQPLLTLNPPDATAPKASIYALAADPYGHSIASGSPERVIRMWDPRSGKRTGKLVGHTDNIRAILISDDGRYLLTGSTDASIKLWSLSSQRCLHTFMYHTDSVWSLHSTHPSLKIFYSGDKSGVVCKVDVEDCSKVADGVCIVLAREYSEEGGEGINKIITADNGLLWTASGSSSVSRWRIPRRPVMRDMADDLFSDSAVTPKRDSTGVELTRSTQLSIYQGNVFLQTNPYDPSHDAQVCRDDELPSYPGVPLSSLVRLAYPNSTFSPSMLASRGRDAEVATLYSAASVVSVPAGRSPFNAVFQHSAILTPSNTQRDMKGHVSVPNVEQDPIHETRTTHTTQELGELASDATPFNSNPDMMITGSRGLVRAVLLNDRMHALTVDTMGEVAIWDIIRGICCGWYTKEDVQAATIRGSLDGSARSRERSSAIGDKEWSPREALEVVRERIEGEAVVSAWSSVGTKTGVLTVHINERCFEAEVYADEAGFDSDEHFNDELRINVGKWVLRNLFLGFIREEQRIRRNRDVQGSQSGQHTDARHGMGGSSSDLDGDSSGPVGPLLPIEMSRSSSLLPTCTTAVISTSALPAILPALPSVTKPLPLLTPMIPLQTAWPTNHTLQSPSSDKPLIPIPRPIRTLGLDIPPPSANREPDYFSARIRRPSTASTALSDGDFSGWGSPGSPPRHISDFSGPMTPTSPGSGFMGRLKSLGKGPGRRMVNDIVPSSPAATNAMDILTVHEDNESSARTATQVLLSTPLSPPSSSEVPSLSLPPNTTVMMSDESYPGWKTVYRGSVASTWADVEALEQNMPLWLLEYVLFNKAVVPPAGKISFVLLPWPNPDPDGEQLPELLNIAQSKLTASKFLRVRKLIHHVQEKLEKMSGTASATPSSNAEPPRPSSPGAKTVRTRAEETYEILCNDIVLALDMTLVTVRQYFWKQSSELIMYYRLRRLCGTGQWTFQLDATPYV